MENACLSLIECQKLVNIKYLPWLVNVHELKHTRLGMKKIYECNKALKKKEKNVL